MAKVTVSDRELSFEEAFDKGGIVLTGRNINPKWLEKQRQKEREAARKDNRKQDSESRRGKPKN